MMGRGVSYSEFSNEKSRYPRHEVGGLQIDAEGQFVEIIYWQDMVVGVANKKAEAGLPGGSGDLLWLRGGRARVYTSASIQ